MAVRKAETLNRMFWDKTFVPSGDGCWIWEGNRNNHGYGKVQRNYKHLGALRVSYEEFTGEIPEGLCVLHKCDNRCCVRPDHLFLGTRRDNTEDMMGKGRHRFKIRKLTMEAANRIKQLLEMGHSQGYIASIYDIDKSMISKIKTGRHWRDA